MTQNASLFRIISPREINFVHYGRLSCIRLDRLYGFDRYLKIQYSLNTFTILIFITIPAIIHTHNQTLYSIIAIIHQPMWNIALRDDLLFI